MDSTLDSERIFLKPGRFGTADMAMGSVKDGFLGTTHHNVRDAKFAIGQVVRARCNGEVGAPGFSEMVYLQASTATQAKSVCVRNGSGQWYAFAAGDASGALDAMAVMAISTMDAGCYGWFWCGGVCPERHVSSLGGEHCRTALLDSINQ